MRINVTQAYLPERKKYDRYVDRIFKSRWLTNRGELLQELEHSLSEFLSVRNVIVVANGSLALQVAYKALELKGKVITSPFSFAATSSTIVWEGLEPIYTDIDDKSFNLDCDKISESLLSSSSAIVPVHVFGNPCNVENFESLAKRYSLKVVYDAAHAFNVNYKDNSLLSYGDISTLSFHSTKLFHTIEGGAIVTNDDHLADKCRNLINFGILGPDKINGIGTNAKMNEFEAAMGLCILDDISAIQEKRREIWHFYKSELSGFVEFQEWSNYSENNYSYAPVLLDSESQLLNVIEALNEIEVFPRRYFYPSLNTVGYNNDRFSCPISESIASRILCLPIYPDLELVDVENIVKKIKSVTFL